MPRKARDFAPWCRVCHRPLRRPHTDRLDHPGTVTSSVHGLCNRDYLLVRQGLIQDPGEDYRPEPSALDPEQLAWRRDLSGPELNVLVLLHGRFHDDSAVFRELAEALGLRRKGGVRGAEFTGDLRI